MADLIHEQMAPLAWDSDGMPFQWPPGTVALKIRKYSGQRGRPPNVWDEHGPAHLPPGATMADLRAKVKNDCGDFRLYPVTATGEELGPVACIKLVPLPDGEQLTVMDDGSSALRPPSPTPAPVRASVPGAAAPRERSNAGQSGGYHPHGGVDLMYMFGRFMDQQEKRDSQLTQMMQTLVETTASVQRSTAELIQVNNSTVQVASGLDALERLPAPREIDEEALAGRLAEMLELEDNGEEPPAKPGFRESVAGFMKGPIGAMAVGAMGNYVQGIQKAVDAKVKAETAAARAQEAQADAIRAQAETVQARAERAKAEVEADYEDWDTEEGMEESDAAAEPESSQADVAPAQAEPGPEPKSDHIEKPSITQNIAEPEPKEPWLMAASSLESERGRGESSTEPAESTVAAAPVVATSTGEPVTPDTGERIATDRSPNAPADTENPSQAQDSPGPDRRQDE